MMVLSRQSPRDPVVEFRDVLVHLGQLGYKRNGNLRHIPSRAQERGGGGGSHVLFRD